VSFTFSKDAGFPILHDGMNMDGGGWKLTDKLKQHTYIHLRQPNDPLVSAIHIHHAQTNKKHMGFQHRRGNMEDGGWKITAKLQ
jgi:hypothetical protein